MTFSKKKCARLKWTRKQNTCPHEAIVLTLWAAIGAQATSRTQSVCPSKAISNSQTPSFFSLKRDHNRPHWQLLHNYSRSYSFSSSSANSFCSLEYRTHHCRELLGNLIDDNNNGLIIKPYEPPYFHKIIIATRNHSFMCEVSITINKGSWIHCRSPRYCITALELEWVSDTTISHKTLEDDEAREKMLHTAFQTNTTKSYFISDRAVSNFIILYNRSIIFSGKSSRNYRMVI